MPISDARPDEFQARRGDGISAGLYAGFGIRCDIPLPELPSASALDAPSHCIDIAIHDLAGAEGLLPRGYTPVDETCALALHTGRHWVRLDDDIHAAIDSRTRIDVWVPIGYPRFDLRHTLLNQLLPRCIAGAGFLPLHGSAVGVDGRAFAFLGPSGSGKSTLAACFASLGSASLGDDCAMVSRGEGVGWSVSPTYSGFRLGASSVRDGIRGRTIEPGDRQRLHDSHIDCDEQDGDGEAVSKQRVGSAFPLAASPLPLGAVYVLGAPPGSPTPAGEPATPGIRALSRTDALAALIENSFRASIDRPALRDALATVAAIVQVVPVFALPRASGIDQLPGFCTAMFDAFSSVR